MLGGSMRMPGLQTILIELTGKEIRGRLMAMSMIVSNMTMDLGGFWSTGTSPWRMAICEVWTR